MGREIQTEIKRPTEIERETEIERQTETEMEQREVSLFCGPNYDFLDQTGQKKV